MPDFRRGVEHIEKANESKGSGSFTPFMPNLYWKDDGQERYVLILNPIDTIPMVKMQKPFTSDGRVELVVARTDEAIGEKKDPIQETWGYAATDLNVCVAVELEPEFELVKGRKRPTGFVVKTREFNRQVRDDKGEATGEKVECTAPVLGSIAQSPSNFFNHVASQDANKAPIHETPALIRRVGQDKNTDYEFELFDHLELDLSGLLENIDDFSYLNAEDLAELSDALEDAETEVEAANIIGGYLLDKWLDEIADADYYQKIFESIDTVARYPVKGWKKGKGTASDEEKAAPQRTSKRSQRKAKQEEAAAEELEANEDDAPAEAPETEEPQEEAPKAKRSSRKAKDEEPAEEASAVTKSSPVAERLAKLKAKAEAEKAAKAA